MWSLPLLLLSSPCAFATTELLRRAVAPDGTLQPLPALVETCDEKPRPQDCRHRAKSPEPRIAVYTYVTGAYEDVRDFNVPCVPPSVDAFFLIDGATREAALPATLELWRRRGWWVLTMLPLIKGTAEVPLARLAAKSLKFTPPSWLLNGTWDWLVEFDGDISLDLSGLRPLVQEYKDKPLLLLKWYWRDCDPWECFIDECDDMLTKRKDYVKTSFDNIVKWRDEMTKFHNDPTRPFQPVNYYELGIMFRHVTHPKASLVAEAFKQVLEQCRTIQRDQFLLPFFLWNASLDKDVEALSIQKLYSELRYCVVATRRGRNLLAHAADDAADGRLRLQATQALDLEGVLDALPPKE